jgi:hypothetical protein
MSKGLQKSRRMIDKLVATEFSALDNTLLWSLLIPVPGCGALINEASGKSISRRKKGFVNNIFDSFNGLVNTNPKETELISQEIEKILRLSADGVKFVVKWTVKGVIFIVTVLPVIVPLGLFCFAMGVALSPVYIMFYGFKTMGCELIKTDLPEEERK